MCIYIYIDICLALALRRRLLALTLLLLLLALGELGIACRRCQPHLRAGCGGGLLLRTHTRLADARDSTSPCVCVCVCVCARISTHIQKDTQSLTHSRACAHTRPRARTHTPA